MISASQDLHERGLAGTVGADQADPLAGTDLEFQLAEDRIAGKLPAQSLSRKENHDPIVAETALGEQARRVIRIEAARGRRVSETWARMRRRSGGGRQQVLAEPVEGARGVVLQVAKRMLSVGIAIERHVDSSGRGEPCE